MNTPTPEATQRETGPVSARVQTGRAMPDRWQIATAICLSLTAFCAFLVGIGAVIYGSGQAGNRTRDFVAYWGSAQQLARGNDPYEPADYLHLDRPTILGGYHMPVMLNPPIMFWLVAPLGMFGAKGAALLWWIFLAVGLAISMYALKKMNGQPGGHLYLLGLCFAPVLYCFMSGQIGVFLLLGIALFLWFQEGHPFWAGAALIFCAVKPHLFLPFGLVLILWILEHKQYRMLAGFASALAAVSAFAFWLDTNAWLQWLKMMRSMQVAEWPVPTLSRWLSASLDPGANWLPFLPVVIGIIWGAWYFFRCRSDWIWQDQGLILLIVSVGCSPYAWLTDEALLLPALLIGACRAQASGRPLLLLAVILGAELCELLGGIGMTSQGYLWTAPAYLVWYLYATRKAGRVERSVSTAAPA